MPTALITGASRGLGAAIAEALAPTHTLLLAGRPSAELDAVADRLGELVKRVSPKVPFSAKQGSQLALAYVAAEDTRRALNALLRTRDDGTLAAALRDPGFDPIRGEPRFRDILRAVAPDGQ